MRIGVIIESEITLGGGYQHEVAIAALLQRRSMPSLEFSFFTTVEDNVSRLRELGIDAKHLQFAFGERLCHRLHQIKAMLIPPLAVPSPYSPFDNILAAEKIDLVLFLSPSPLALELRGHNYVYTVWDLCHLDHPEFPEVNFKNQFEAREYLYRNVLRKAVSVIVDSDHGKVNLQQRHNVDAARVAVLPFLPCVDSTFNFEPEGAVDVKVKYGISGDYIFYPAQFWAHKNHIYILRALKLMVDNGSPVHAVFSGSDKGNLPMILEHASALGLSKLVHYIGFVQRSEIPSLYRQALALVMPTWFGPTNLPPLEAFQWDCPVCYSDLPGLREQVGDAAFLLDLSRPESLVEALEIIRSDPETVAKKKRAGKEIISSWTEEDYWFGLKRIFDAYSMKMQCWKRGEL